MNNFSLYSAHYLVKKWAASLFSIFIPIYLYVNGFSIIEVGIFYFFQEVTNLFFTYFLYKKANILGVKNLLILATISQVILLLLIYSFLDVSYLFLLSLSIMRGFHDSFYWGANDMIMVHLSEKGVGSFLGKWHLLTGFLQVATIPLSAYVLDNYSPLWLIAISIILLLVSIFPLVKINLLGLSKNTQVSLKELLTKKENQYISIASHLNEFLTKLNDTFVPFYIFLLFSNYLSAGLAGSLAILATSFYAFFVSHKSEHKTLRLRLFSINVVLYILLVVLFPMFATTTLLYLSFAVLALLRTGVCLSTTVRINQLCLIEDCYVRKMAGRMAENIAGMMIGGILIIGGIVNMQFAFIVCGGYILIVAAVVSLFREYA